MREKNCYKKIKKLRKKLSLSALPRTAILQVHSVLLDYWAQQ
jgi:hypothetical protein